METVPIISLDLKKKRIRIHKSTLHLLSDPAYIQFLVNPDLKTIAIKTSHKGAKLSHKINYKSAYECEFYSKELLDELGTVSPGLINGCTYRLKGTLFKNKGLAIFNMDKLIPVLDAKPDLIHTKD